jgi:hypothetical protein
MPNMQPRRFTLLDAMALIAATAVGLFLFRLTSPEWSDIRATLGRSDRGMRRFTVLQDAGQAVVPFLAAWTVALLLLRLRRPRPRLRRALLQPGAVACAAATVAIAVEATWILSLLAVGSRFVHPSSVFVGYAQQVSFAVLGGWTALAAGGRWRSEPSWLDRAGRAAGGSWIVVTAVHFGSYFLTG